MTTSDLFTLLIKFLGIATVFWGIKGFVHAELASRPIYANASSTTLAVTDIVAGIVLIFMAPLIASIIYPQPDVQ
ncbi:MAG: hypothetical protein ACI87O_003247 [Planctomycetota bacterium]|jgi:hypothetical protein